MKMVLDEIRHRNIFVILVFLSVFLIYYYFTLRTQNIENISKFQYIEILAQEETTETLKTILYWHPMFRRPDHELGTGQEIFQNCSYKNCYATYNQSLLPIYKYAALIFHGWDYDQRKHGKPTLRAPNQIYIFEILESPDNTPKLPKENNNFFNWTMTYRSDSDVIRHYGRIQKIKRDYEPPLIEEIQNRSKKIAWFVSHCSTKGKREILAKRLSEFIPVDIYGACGNFSCSRKQEQDCYTMLEEDYKFYLSFENSVCEEYITEKFYQVLNRNVIPIVYGGGDYEKIAPPKSFINVMDFNSVEDLVRYLQFLDNNAEEYIKYFEWKKDYFVVDNHHQEPTLCDLCEKLHKPLQHKVYNDISAWWRGPTNNYKCKKVLTDELNQFIFF